MLISEECISKKNRLFLKTLFEIPLTPARETCDMVIFIVILSYCKFGTFLYTLLQSTYKFKVRN